ncbi:MAG: rod shape-determining protein MreC [Anaerolineales bacterium]|jgi:rod shape-determining protein MreC
MNSSFSLPTVVLSLLVIGILFLALGGYLAPLSQVALAPLVDAQTWVSARYQAIQEFITAPRDMARLTQRNSELEAEVARLQAQIIELEQENAQLDVFSALLNFAQAHPENDYLSATVIGRDPNPFLRYIIINRGSDEGLRRGMPVVSQQGLVGRIAAVTAGGARVQLITDPSAVVNIRLEESGAEALLSGSITGEVSLDFIPQDVTIETGDLVLTSGLGGNYPPNILIGRITGVRTQPFELYQNASVQPVVDFSKLQIVSVIINFRPVDISPLIPTPSAP